jgi:5'-3' exonuclease
MIIDDNYGSWKHLITKNILDYIKKFEPTQVIIASDSHSWRKEIYPEYKAHRKTARDASIINFDEFYKVNDAFVEHLKKTFSNIHWLKIQRCEVDDIIAVLVKEYNLGDVVIASTDKDFIQLLKYPNVKLYSPITQTYTESINAEKDLELKIIQGDRGDNITAILPKTGPVKASKLLEEGVLYTSEPSFDILIKEQIEKLKITDTIDDVKERINRNTTLISFEKIPEDIKSAIINTFEGSVLNSFSSMTFLSFCVTNNMKQLRNEISNYSECLKRLTTEVSNERTNIRNQKKL